MSLDMPDRNSRSLVAYREELQRTLIILVQLDPLQRRQHALAWATPLRVHFKHWKQANTDGVKVTSLKASCASQACLTFQTFLAEFVFKISICLHSILQCKLTSSHDGAHALVSNREVLKATSMYQQAVCVCV